MNTKKTQQSPIVRILPLIILAPILYFFWAQNWGAKVEESLHPAPPPQGIRVGKTASDFAVDANNTFTRQDFHLNSVRGFPIVLHFWATWCGPCVSELPELLKLATRLRKEGYSLVAVAEDADWHAVDRFFLQYPELAEMKNLMVIVLDPSGKIASLYGSQQFPETFLINQDFLVDNKFIGAQDWKHPGMQAYLQNLKTQRKETTP